MNALRGFFRRPPQTAQPASVCSDVVAWSKTRPDVALEILDEPITLARTPPHTIEPEIDAEYIKRYTGNLKGRYLARMNGARIMGENGIVMLPDGSFAVESIYTEKMLEQDALYQTPPTRFRRTKGNFFSLVVTWSKSGNYYHWLHDSLSRLYRAAERLPADTQFIIPAKTQRFQDDSLTLLGIPPERRVRLGANDALELDTFYFAPPTTNSGSDRASAARWLRQKFWDACGIRNPKAERRLYISRRNAPNRRVLNEEQIQEVLTRYGFETVECETLTLREQISLFSTASAVVAAHGAGLTNIWFAPEGARVLDILEPSHRGWQYVYWSLCNAVNHEYWYFWGESVPPSAQGEQKAYMTVSPDYLGQTLQAMRF